MSEVISQLLQAIALITGVVVVCLVVGGLIDFAVTYRFRDWPRDDDQ